MAIILGGSRVVPIIIGIPTRFYPKNSIYLSMIGPYFAEFLSSLGKIVTPNVCRIDLRSSYNFFWIAFCRPRGVQPKIVISHRELHIDQVAMCTVLMNASKAGSPPYIRVIREIRGLF